MTFESPTVQAYYTPNTALQIGSMPETASSVNGYFDLITILRLCHDPIVPKMVICFRGSLRAFRLNRQGTLHLRVPLVATSL